MADSTPTPPPEPQDAAPPPPPPAAPTAGTPSGVAPGAVKVRQPIAVVLLFIVTLGIYSFYWFYQVFRELKETEGEGLGGGVALLLAILGYFCFVTTIALLFILPSEIGNMYERHGRPKPVTGLAGFWNLIPIVGGIIWVVKCQHALNRRWEALGA